MTKYSEGKINYRELREFKYSEIMILVNNTPIDKNIRLSVDVEKGYLMQVKDKTNKYYRLINEVKNIGFDNNIVKLCKILNKLRNNSIMESFYILFLEYMDILIEELETESIVNNRDSICALESNVSEINQIKGNLNTLNDNLSSKEIKTSNSDMGKVILFPKK